MNIKQAISLFSDNNILVTKYAGGIYTLSINIHNLPLTEVQQFVIDNSDRVYKMQDIRFFAERMDEDFRSFNGITSWKTDSYLQGWLKEAGYKCQ